MSVLRERSLVIDEQNCGVIWHFLIIIIIIILILLKFISCVIWEPKYNVESNKMPFIFTEGGRAYYFTLYMTDIVKYN